MRGLNKGCGSTLLVSATSRSVGADKGDNLNAIMSLANNFTSLMALTTPNSANNHHFLHHESLFQSVRQVCAFSSILSVCYHRSSAEGEREGGEGRPFIRGKEESQKEAASLSKAWCWAAVKNRNWGRLASISAGVDGPIDSKQRSVRLLSHRGNPPDCLWWDEMGR